MNSQIYFNRDSSRWIFQSNTDPTKFFNAEDRRIFFLPIGRQEWYSHGAIQSKKLSLSGCGMNEFTCDSGQCVPLE